MATRFVDADRNLGLFGGTFNAAGGTGPYALAYQSITNVVSVSASFFDLQPMAAGQKFIFGMHFKGNFNNGNMFRIISDFGTVAASLGADAAGRLSYYTGDGANLKGTATVPCMRVSNGSWHWIEGEITLQTTATGTVKIWCDGRLVLNLSSVATVLAATLTGVGFRANSGQTTQWANLFVFDDQGTANNTSNIGESIIEGLSPTGAGTYAQFTPSAGSNWQNVDEVPHNSDTDYNSTSGVGNKDSFAFSDLATAAGTVRTVVQSIVHRKDAVGVRTVDLFAKSGATEVSSGGIPVGSSYVRDWLIRDDVPGGTGWTIAQVNAAEFGYKLAS